MNPIDAITSITAGVLRRIADSIDAQTPSQQSSGGIHIHLHITDDQPDGETKPRGWARLKR
ncbi:hypothetical protein [Rhodococcus spongiicola]|uniref:Uncharacterized protein n=1 Tax=Rhodococcus spongiicola TaxID=2487352 RepID=A0A3S3A958_9NOCA|nr:hypothetical protein [Rhodococcus spongiicola]RVW04883.1 hypothetical protein EF834_07825 [Rhodococcus spongiicola]